MTEHLSEITLWRDDEILEYLKLSRLFSHLPDHLLQQLIPLSEMASYLPGTKILEEGQINNKVFFLMNGGVSVYAGNEFILKLQRKGDVFGEMSVITHRPCAASVIAETQVELFSIEANDIGEYTELDSQVLQNSIYRLFAMILSEKLVMTTEKAKQFETINRILHQDVEDRTKLVDALKKAKTDAEMANQAQTQFLANMSHEIRTPLNSIIGFGQILLKQAKQLSLPQEFLSYLENIETSGVNLSELINNVLDLSRIQAGKIPLSLASLNLRLLVQSIFQVNKAQAIPKNLRFNYSIDSAVPEMI
ncbi:MAG: cyclic nucleotide-binding domain-containing protein, partial [SAR324 cluster bacterium]|nr:cyclic nucleotide-binding domain-containing protein [SAR324 cluster bacterium]